MQLASPLRPQLLGTDRGDSSDRAVRFRGDIHRHGAFGWVHPANVHGGEIIEHVFYASMRYHHVVMLSSTP